MNWADEDYTREEVQLMRIKFMSELGKLIKKGELKILPFLLIKSYRITLPLS
jgi:hypothetical protein